MTILKVCYIRRLTDIEKVKIFQKTGEKYKWVTEGEAVWEDNGVQVRVPKGFLTDGSSGGPDAGNCWLFHDLLYSTHHIGGNPCTRQEADTIMINILKWERFTWYPFAVRILFALNPFWCFSRAWKKSGNRGPQFIKDYLAS